MEDFYKRHYTAYHEKTFHIDPASFLKPLIRHLKPGAGILDIGCGSGRDLCWFKRRGFSVTGFERSAGLAAFARKNAGCEIIEGDFEVYDFSKLDFEAILLCGSLVHVPHNRFEIVFANIIKAIGQAGSILISLKQGNGSSTGEDGRTFYFWQDIDLRDIFKKHGFNILEFHKDISKLDVSKTWLSYVLMRHSV
jgi:SAM-dependent methyltransferase